MAAFEVVALDTATPQLRAPGAADTYTFPRAAAFSAAITYGGVTLSNSVTGTGSMVLSAAPTFTGTSIFRAANAIRSEAASTQDAVIVAGRAGGTSSFAVTLTPTTLSASRTLTLPDNSGTVLTTGAAVTVAQGGTGLTSGTSGGIPFFSSTSAMTSSALLTANAIMIGGGAGVAPSTTSTAAGILTFIGTPSSANLATAVTDETGSGSLVFANTPTLVTPNIGAATGTSLSATGNVTGSTLTASATTANTAYLTGTSYSLTGSSAVSMVDLSGTWNTTGVPSAIKVNITDTASGSASLLVDLQTGGTSRFNVSKAGTVTVADAANFVVGTSTGSKIGTATSQKLGFWNATPIVQPTTAVAAATVAATGTGDVVAASTTFDGYTIPQIVKALRNAGLLA